MLQIFIPSLMRKLTNDKHIVEIDALSITELINKLDDQYPGMKNQLTEGNLIKDGLSVVINDEISNNPLLEQLVDGTEIHFVPTIGGGTIT
jgi:molybdopterin converting factor small subunit|tara:strand:+ start:206 stop:478 length:273 start_codon:yes stop_codon:yes gene_type:complete